MTDNTTRKNVTISKDVAKWYENKSKETGMSQSSLMAMAMSEYIKMQEMDSRVVNFQEFITETAKIINDKPKN